MHSEAKQCRNINVWVEKGLCRAMQQEWLACAQKAPELPHGFQKSIYKDQVREGCPRVCDQLMCNSLIGWWWGNRQLTLSILQFSSVIQSCPTLCDSMDCSTPGFHVHHQLLEPTQINVHCVGDAIQPSHPLLSPFPPTFNISQHEGLFKWVSSSHQVAKVLEFQRQHQSFPWIFRTDFL